eukprot:7335915-Pyramimonas_sp.AAC.1
MAWAGGLRASAGLVVAAGLFHEPSGFRPMRGGGRLCRGWIFRGRGVAPSPAAPLGHALRGEF